MSTPTIVTRAGWGARSPSRQPNRTTWGQRIGFVVHHSATATGATVRGIQNYQMDTNGWVDIGYNWLVTQDGRIWEGRQGTWLAIGAHVAGHNTATIGVCWIGNSTATVPSDAALRSIRWLYDEANRRAGRTLTRYYHGQLGQTACAGTRLNAWVSAGMRAPDTSGGDMWNHRINSFIVQNSGPVATNSTGHALARAHQYGHRLNGALFAGSTNYGALDAIAYPGTEENPLPTGASSPDRRNGSWRYAIQRIWRWSYWGYRRTVRIEAQNDLIIEQNQQILANQADIIEMLNGQRREPPRLTANDVTPHLRSVSVDDEDPIGESDGEDPGGEDQSDATGDETYAGR